jgi:hypothetical protein
METWNESIQRRHREFERTKAHDARVQRQREGFVYFVQADDGPIKIGYSRNVRARLAALQVNTHLSLRLLGSMPGGEILEAQLHARFSEDRIRGEWFAASTDLLGFIRQMAVASV